MLVMKQLTLNETVTLDFHCIERKNVKVSKFFIFGWTIPLNLNNCIWYKFELEYVFI